MTTDTEKQIDGYWLAQGMNMVTALKDVLHPDLTTLRCAATGEYIASLLQQAYEMGIKVGNLESRVERLEKP